MVIHSRNVCLKAEATVIGLLTFLRAIFENISYYILLILMTIFYYLSDLLGIPSKSLFKTVKYTLILLNFSPV